MAPQSFGIYVVEEKVGEGSFGDVYRCRDPFLKKQIAVKALKSHLLLSKDATILGDFFKEAELLAHFNHPAFTHIHSLNPDPPWIAMEFLEGETLEAVLRRKDGLTLERIASIFQAVCDGLHHIHEQVEPKYRTIHRDLKPANLLLTRDGRVKIIDFGVAKAEIGDPTIVGIVKGTPLYMSPEHMAGTVDHRSDLWSLAVILFETLTGTRPYPDPDPGQAWSYAKLRRFEHAVLNERHAPFPAEMPQAVVQALVSFFDQAFQVEKEKRFQSALKFRAALDRVVDQIAREADPAELAFPPLSEADALLMEASDAFDRGDYAAARDMYEKVLHLKPDSEEAHHWLLQIEDRLRAAEARELEAVAARRAALEPAVERLRRVALRPAIGLPEAAVSAAREAVARFEGASAGELEAVAADLERAGVVVGEGITRLVREEAKAAAAALDAAGPGDEKQAATRRQEVDRLTAVEPSDPIASSAALARLREISRRARADREDVAGRLVDQAAGVAPHLELLLATHQGEPPRSLPGAEEGWQALRELRDAGARREPAILEQKLMAAAGAVDSLGVKAAETRRDALRQVVSRSGAALAEALPDTLAAPLGLKEIRDRALRSAADAAAAQDAAGLVAIETSLQEALTTLRRVGPALRPVPPEPVKPGPPAVEAPVPREQPVRAARVEEMRASEPSPPPQKAPLASPPPASRVAPAGEVALPSSKAPAAPPAQGRVARPAVPPEPAPGQDRPRSAPGPGPVRRRDPDELSRERESREARRGQPPPAGSSKLKWGLIAGAVLAAALVLLFVLRPGPPSEAPPPVAPTEAGVVVKAIPWGRVEQVLDLRSSKPVVLPAGTTTPARIVLPPGNYRITVSNPDFGRATVEAEVRVGEMRAVALQLPRFDVDKLLDEL